MFKFIFVPCDGNFLECRSASSYFWDYVERLSSFGAFWGTLLGFISGIIVWLVVASAQDGSSLLVAMGKWFPWRVQIVPLFWLVESFV